MCPVPFFRPTGQLVSTHLADDEHVLAPDDALLHLGAESFAYIHLIEVGVGGVYVPIAGSNRCLYCTLDGRRRQVVRLQQEKYGQFSLFLLPSSVFTATFFTFL